jgi:hypothetical protein
MVNEEEEAEKKSRKKIPSIDSIVYYYSLRHSRLSLCFQAVFGVGFLVHQLFQLSRIAQLDLCQPSCP